MKIFKLKFSSVTLRRKWATAEFASVNFQLYRSNRKMKRTIRYKFSRVFRQLYIDHPGKVSRNHVFYRKTERLTCNSPVSDHCYLSRNEPSCKSCRSWLRLPSSSFASTRIPRREWRCFAWENGDPSCSRNISLPERDGLCETGKMKL